QLNDQYRPASADLDPSSRPPQSLFVFATLTFVALLWIGVCFNSYGAPGPDLTRCYEGSHCRFPRHLVRCQIVIETIGIVVLDSFHQQLNSPAVVLTLLAMQILQKRCGHRRAFRSRLRIRTNSTVRSCGFDRRVSFIAASLWLD